MADHELGAPFHAIRAVRLASPASEALNASQRECQWQRDRLPEAIRDLVLSDQELRATKFQSVFDSGGGLAKQRYRADDQKVY